MRFRLILPAILGLFLGGGCMQSAPRTTQLKLLGISAETEPLPFTAAAGYRGFYAGTFSGKIPAGQRTGGIFTYELYYLLSIGNGLDGTLCSEAGFRLRSIVVEREESEIIGIHFLKDLTGTLVLSDGKLTVKDVSANPSFTPPEIIPPSQKSASSSPPRLSIGYRQTPADAAAFSLVFDIRVSSPDAIDR